MAVYATRVEPAQTECPPGCCTGDELLCVSIPCPITVVLLGLSVQAELPCIRLTAGAPISGAQISQLREAFSGTVKSLGAAVGRMT